MHKIVYGILGLHVGDCGGCGGCGGLTVQGWHEAASIFTASGSVRHSIILILSFLFLVQYALPKIMCSTT